MTKHEFLSELRAVLSAELATGAVAENIQYYDDYISAEVSKGRSEQEVTEEIGSPRLIAKTILDTAQLQDQRRGTPEHDSAEQQRSHQTTNRNVKYYDLNKWYVKVIALLIVVMIVLVVFTIISGVLSILLPMLPAIALVALVMWLVRGPRN